LICQLTGQIQQSGAEIKVYIVGAFFALTAVTTKVFSIVATGIAFLATFACFFVRRRFLVAHTADSSSRPVFRFILSHGTPTYK
jgi:uncharacterized membrane-anchored protein